MEGGVADTHDVSPGHLCAGARAEDGDVMIAEESVGRAMAGCTLTVITRGF